MTTRLLTLILALAIILPVPSAFALEEAPVASYSSHRDSEEDIEDSDDDDDYRERYSSSVSRKIRSLDDDPVEEMPVPVLFVSYSAITPDFGDPRGGGTRTHEGQDILAPRGSFIISPTEAVVTRTGKGDSSGIYVYTAGPGGENFRYMHLDRIASGIKSGTVLKPGDLIGFVGNTGNASAAPPHLHFEIREGRKAIDPHPRLTGELTKQELLASLISIVDVLKKIAKED